MLSPFPGRECSPGDSSRKRESSKGSLKAAFDHPGPKDALEKAPTLAVAFAFVFLIAGFLLATSSPCTFLPGVQVCVPDYQSTGNLLLLFGGIFLVLWVLLIAYDEIRAK